MSKEKRESWASELDALGGLAATFAANFDAHPAPNDRMTNSTKDAIRDSGFGALVADYDALDPSDDEGIINAAEHAVQLTRAALDRPLPWSTSTFIGDVRQLKEAYDAASTVLRANDTDSDEPESLARVIYDLEVDYNLSLAITLSGQAGIVQKLAHWRKPTSHDGNKNKFFDVRTFELADEEGPGRVPFRELEIALDGGYTTFQLGEGLKSFDLNPKLQSMQYGQWFTYIFALWEERYRGRIAAAHGVAPDGESWKRRDISCRLFGDIRKVRNDFVHNKGVVDESAETEILTWFTEGKPVHIALEQMMSFIDKFPREELEAEPVRAPKGNPQNFPWPVAPEIVEDVRDRIKELKIPKALRKEVGNDALRMWLDSKARPATH